MSRWLARALAAHGCPDSVPIAPIVPKGRPLRPFGTNGANGTGPAVSPSTDQALAFTSETISDLAQADPVQEGEPSAFDFEERAAILEYDGGLSRGEAEALAASMALNEPVPIVPLVPIGLSDLAKTDTLSDSPPRPGLLVQAWSEGLKGLSALSDPCPGFRTGQWPKVHRAALAFLDEHGDAAAALGWTTIDLFGVHPTHGVLRLDCCGALSVSGGCRVAHVAADLIRYADGLAFRQRPISPSVPLWAKTT